MSRYLKLALAALVAIATGSRLKPSSVIQHDFSSATPVIWKKGNIYVCAQKWEKGSGTFQKKFCLAKFDEVIDGAAKIEEARKKGKTTPPFRVTKDLRKCTAQSKDYRFKICNLKGKEDVRLNYKDKKYVPKSCLHRLHQDFQAPDGGMIPLLQAAVVYSTCQKMYNLPARSQGTLVREKPVEAKKPPLKKPTKSEGDIFDNLEELGFDADEESSTTTSSTVVDDEVIDANEIAEEVIRKLSASDEEYTVSDAEIQKLLDMDKDEEDVDGLEMGMESLDVEDSTMDQEDLPEDISEQDKDASMNLDGMNIAQIRALWKKRDQENPNRT